jgi:aminobenzoyl-glutamate utilization protein A
LNCALFYGDALYRDFPEPELLSQWKDKITDLTGEDQQTESWIGRLNGRTGVVAWIEGSKPGPTLGFRFDIDGLPIAESTEMTHRPFSQGFHAINGNMHACGHDGHVAMGLVLARLLADQAPQLHGNCYLFFQPAEETIFGGKIFSKLPFVKEIDYFFAIHIGLVPSRNVICGLSFLADKRYQVSFRGRSAHAGAQPEAGRNALLAACVAVTQLYALSRHSQGASRINVGKFSADNAANIIADNAQFELDLRGETNAICDYLDRRAGETIRGAAQMHAVEADMTFVADAETSVNSPELIQEVKKACLDIGIEEAAIVDRFLVSGSEDATFIMNEVLRNGGLATYIGLCSPTYGGHHNETFDFDEDLLARGVRLLYQLANNIMDKPA